MALVFHSCLYRTLSDNAFYNLQATWAAHGVTAAHYMKGGAYTVGATQNISTRLTSMCRAFGGECLIDATVRSIIIENGKAVGVRVSNTDSLEEATDPDKVPVVEIRARKCLTLYTFWFDCRYISPSYCQL